VPQTEFTNIRFKLGKDNTLYLFTDGLVEAKISATERLERDGLLKLLGKFDQKRPIERLQRIVREVRKNQSELADDITLLMIELEQKGHSLKTEHRDSLAVAKRAAK
jgi:serine phosphatase RsbU (regulator of sigma subunit)